MMEAPEFKDLMAGMLQKHMIKRPGTGDDIAFGALYLASDEAAWVTGTNLVIDGGLTAW